MLLNNVTLINDSEPLRIAISGKKITAVGNTGKSTGADNVEINFTGAIAFPGLINSHDHLDFNCFSPLGHRIYNNYTEWGNHIHEEYKADIAAVLKIPQHARTAWGMYKNLLAGVTTVINHGDVLKIKNPLITIYQEPQSLHSVKFQKNWRWKLNNPFFKNKPCLIHTGEGIDKPSADEINELLKWNLLNRKLIGIHAVAMNRLQAKKFTGLVWCPESNKVLLGRHADIIQLKENTRVVFGTDATLTGNWNIWQHLRLARALQLVNDAELFAMVTSSAAQLWRMNNGSIQPGKDADIVIAKTKNGHAAWDDLFSVNPSTILMVLHKGQIRMFDKTLFSQINSLYADLRNFSQVTIKGITKFIEGDLPSLLKVIRKHNPHAGLPPEIFDIIKHPGND